MSKKHKIMIDLRVITKNAEHGIARYAIELLKFLLQSEQAQKFEFILLVNSNSKAKILAYHLPQNFKLVTLKTGWLSFLSQFELLAAIWKFKPNLFHAPSFIVPLFSFVPLIATIHDLNHVALEKNYSFKQKVYYFLLRLRLVKALAIITVSLFSKNEIIKFFKITADKIHVIYNGVSPLFKLKAEFSPEQINFVRNKYHLPERYILAIGNHKPHKNLVRLVEAYCTGAFFLPLVILSDKHGETRKIAKKYHKQENIIFLSSIVDEDFPLFYALSTVFIYPSLYEGFGLPPLEAAKSGVPVVTSRVTSLPEVLKNTAIYMDPSDVNDIKRALTEALFGDKEILQNNIAQALALSHKYNWQKMGEETLLLYSTCILSQAEKKGNL